MDGENLFILEATDKLESILEQVISKILTLKIDRAEVDLIAFKETLNS
jgi:hypothetical protein